jgi:hypothetical protein
MNDDATPQQPEPFPRVPIPPEIKEWALRTLDMKEVEAQMKEIEEGKGKTLDEFIDDLEREVLGETNVSPTPEPYRVSYSEDVQQQLRTLGRRAKERGMAGEFVAALRALDARLRIYPQFGEPLRDLTHQVGQIWIGTIPPLVVRYSVLDLKRVVMVVLPVAILPHSGF